MLDFLELLRPSLRAVEDSQDLDGVSANPVRNDVRR